MAMARWAGTSPRSRLVVATRKLRSSASWAVSSTRWVLPKPYSPITARTAPPAWWAAASPSTRLARSLSSPMVSALMCCAGATPTRSASSSWRAAYWLGGMGWLSSAGSGAAGASVTSPSPTNSWRGRRKRSPLSKRTSHSLPLR
jgi:hypothetical protein